MNTYCSKSVYLYTIYIVSRDMNDFMFSFCMNTQQNDQPVSARHHR